MSQLRPRGSIGLVVCAACALLATSCGTVDAGVYEGVRDLKLDENYYYCVIQPQVITAKGCSAGNSGEGPASCHAQNTAMRLKDIGPDKPDKSTACTGGKPTLAVTQAERDNYAAAQLRASRDIESSALITRPTGQSNHPRTIFPSDSPEATLIRQWIKGGK